MRRSAGARRRASRRRKRPLRLPRRRARTPRCAFASASHPSASSPPPRSPSPRFVVLLARDRAPRPPRKRPPIARSRPPRARRRAGAGRLVTRTTTAASTPSRSRVTTAPSLSIPPRTPRTRTAPRRALASGDASGALDDADAALARHPGWVKGHYRRGACLVALERYDEATRAYRAGLEVDPTNAQLKAGLERARGARRGAARRSARRQDARQRGVPRRQIRRRRRVVRQGTSPVRRVSPNPNLKSPRPSSRAAPRRVGRRRRWTRASPTATPRSPSTGTREGVVAPRVGVGDFSRGEKKPPTRSNAPRARPEMRRGERGARRIAAFSDVE